MTDAEREELRGASEGMNDLKTDVALLKQFNEKVVEPTLKDISTKLDLLNFYTKEEVDVKLKGLQKRRWYENSLSAAFGAILTSFLLYLTSKFWG